MTRRYPAVTSRAPWAYAAIHLGLDAASRDWDTDYRGWLWVHQGKTRDRDAPDFLVPDYALDLGAVIGAVRLTGIASESASRWAEQGQPFHWQYQDARYLPEPMSINGQPKLWHHSALLGLPEPEQLPVAQVIDAYVPSQRTPPPRPRGGAVFSPDTRR